MVQNVGAIPANLHSQLDNHYATKLAGLINKVNDSKYDLVHTIDPLRRIIQKFHHDPQYKGKDRDLTQFAHDLGKLQQLYKEHAQELHKADPDRKVKIDQQLKQFEEVLGKVKKLEDKDLEFLDDMLDRLRGFETKNVEQAANQIFLFGQLMLSMSHIMSLMQKTQCEAQERLARNTLNR